MALANPVFCIWAVLPRFLFKRGYGLCWDVHWLRYECCVCVCVCADVCMCIYIYIYIYVCDFWHTNTHTHTHTHTNNAHTHTHTHVHTHVHTALDVPRPPSSPHSRTGAQELPAAHTRPAAAGSGILPPRHWLLRNGHQPLTPLQWPPAQVQLCSGLQPLAFSLRACAGP
jgi:hypothetical protein